MRRRQRNKNNLGWALLLSLLINHSMIMPGFYLLIGLDKPSREPEFTEVELVPDPEEEPPPEEKKDKPRLPRLKAPKKIALKQQPKKKLPEQKKQQEEKRQEQDKPKVKPPEQRMKMVEVNNPETETPPPDARYLSDKNRRVEKETRARQTNLVKDQPKPKPTSRPSQRPEPDPGTPKKVVAELRKQPAPTPKVQPPREVSPLMRMRLPAAPPEKQEPLAEAAPAGSLPMPKEAPPRPRLNLTHRSLDRIYGQRAHEEREMARLSPSRPTGSSHQHKWEQIRSSLENFVPEVRPGNQTALGTRAHPYALYIARAHRKIHRLWGFGFLPDLDMKADGHPMNDMNLWTMLELVVTPDGKIKKATIVKPSGLLTFDAAALSTVFTATPFPRSPRAIRSGDGNVYLHWRFHRNQRQCGTFGVDPYILDKPPVGPIDGDLSEVAMGAGGDGQGQRRLRKLNRPAMAASPGRSAGAGPANAPAHNPHQGHSHNQPAAQPTTPPSSEQEKAVAKVVRSFLQRLAAGDARGMAKSCALPFSSGGREVAASRKDLERMFKDLIKDMGRANKGAKGASVSLMNVMQAREKLGTLPPGAEYGKGMLVGKVSLGDSNFTLLLQQEQGTLWRVVGLNR